MKEATVFENQEMHRFEIDLGNENAVLEYTLEGNNMTLVHTYVPTSHRGNHLADKLANFALEHIKNNHRKAIISCPYVTLYLERHPEYEAILLSKGNP